MTTDTTTAASTAEEVRDQDQAERDAALQEKLEEAESLGEGETFDWEEMGESETASTLERIEGKLQEETWHAVVLEDVVMEFYNLSEADKKTLTQMAGTFAQVVQADSVDDLEPETIEVLERYDETLEEMLARLTVDQELTQEWWADGSNYPATLKIECFRALYKHHKDVMGNISKFQQDESGAGVRGDAGDLGADSS